MALVNAQTTYHVDASSCPSTGNGTAAMPFCTIQEGIQAASPGDRVLVHPGDYPEVIDYLGKDIAVKSAEGPASTTMEGAVFQSGEGPAAVLEGFRIDGPELRDSSVLCMNASPTVLHNLIEDSQNLVFGAVELVDSSALLVENTIRDNWMWFHGGGVFVQGGAPVLIGNVIEDNEVFEDCGDAAGGGIYIERSDVQLIGNYIAFNRVTDTSSNVGGGIAVFSSQLHCIGNTIFANRAFDGLAGFCILPDPIPGEGGGIYARNSTVVIEDTILWGNQASLGPQVRALGSSVSIAYSTVEGGPSGILGNVAITDSVLSADPGLQAGALPPNSPMIDRGAPFRAAGGTDADGDPRILDGDGDGHQRVDIGWDEWNPTTLAVSGTPGLGQPLQLTTDGRPGQVYFLVGALAPGDLPFAPFGSLLLAPGTLTPMGSGRVPGTNTLTIPNDPTLQGTEIYFQSLALTLGARVGSFSRRVAVQVL